MHTCVIWLGVNATADCNELILTVIPHGHLVIRLVRRAGNDISLFSPVGQARNTKCARRAGTLEKAFDIVEIIAHCSECSRSDREASEPHTRHLTTDYLPMRYRVFNILKYSKIY